MEIGQRLPDVLGKDQDGRLWKTEDLKGKKIVLYISPRDSTTGCTNEACNLRDNYSRFLAEGYAVIGVSMQGAESHRKFIAKNNLPFPLIADVDGTLIKELGAYGEKKMYGRTTMGTLRMTFIADENGVITRIFGSGKVKVKEHASQILD